MTQPCTSLPIIKNSGLLSNGRMSVRTALRSSKRCRPHARSPERLRLEQRRGGPARVVEHGLEAGILVAGQQAGCVGALAAGASSLGPPIEARIRSDKVLVHRDVVEIAEGVLQLLELRHEALAPPGRLSSGK